MQNILVNIALIIMIILGVLCIAQVVVLQIKTNKLDKELEAQLDKELIYATRYRALEEAINKHGYIVYEKDNKIILIKK